MKPDRFFKFSAYVYIMLAVCILLVLSLWSSLTNKPLDSIVLGTGIFLASICVFFGYRVFNVGSASFSARRNFTIYAGIFCGGMASIAGWVAGVIFGVPLLIALLGMPEIWRLHRKNKDNKSMSKSMGPD